MFLDSQELHYQIKTLDYFSKISLFTRDKQVYEHRHLIFNSSESSTQISAGPFEARSCAAQMAQQLYDKYKNEGPIVLALSGGLDSQAMLFSFLEAGVPFEVAVMRFKDHLNEHDIGHCLDLLTSLGVEFNIHELDIMEFLNSGEYIRYAQNGQTNSPQFAAHVWLAEQIQGVPVFSGEPWHRVYESRDENEPVQDRPFYLPRYKEYGTEIALAQKRRSCISHFFEFSMQWLQQIVHHPEIHRYCRLADPEGSYRAKYLFYRRLGFPVSLTSGASKLTGFERVYSITAINNLVSDYYHFNILYRRPLEKIFPSADKRTIQLEGFTGNFWQEMSRLSSFS